MRVWGSLFGDGFDFGRSRACPVFIARAVRWLAGRPIEILETDEATLPVVAELVEPGLVAATLLDRIEAARTRIRTTYDTVVGAGSLDAIAA